MECSERYCKGDIFRTKYEVVPELHIKSVRTCKVYNVLWYVCEHFFPFTPLEKK